MNKKKYLVLIFLLALCSLIVWLTKPYWQKETVSTSIIIDTAAVYDTATADDYSIYFIDVGQGDSILVETNKKHYVLIDSGPSDAANKLSSFLNTRGVKSIQEVILTHPHADHYAEFKDIVGTFTIGTFLYGNYPDKDISYVKLLNQLKQNLVPINEVKDDETFTLDNLIFKVFYPNSASGDNNNSVVLKISNKSGMDFLACGDLEIEGINFLIARHKDDIDVELLKVNHHGSVTGTNENFLDATTPLDAFISVGAGNKYKHPHQPVLDLLNQKGIKTYRTDLSGSIEVDVSGKSYTVKEHIQ